MNCLETDDIIRQKNAATTEVLFDALYKELIRNLLHVLYATVQLTYASKSVVVDIPSM